jgi:hypothetical protein
MLAEKSLEASRRKRQSLSNARRDQQQESSFEDRFQNGSGFATFSLDWLAFVNVCTANRAGIAICEPWTQAMFVKHMRALQLNNALFPAFKFAQTNRTVQLSFALRMRHCVRCYVHDLWGVTQLHELAVGFFHGALDLL